MKCWCGSAVGAGNKVTFLVALRIDVAVLPTHQRFCMLHKIVLNFGDPNYIS